MSRIKHLVASCSHFVHQYFIWFLVGSYVVASVCPALGLWIRGVSLGEIGLFREKTTVTLPMVMLALLLANAGLWAQTSGLKHLMRGSLVLLAGLGANLAIPIVYIFGVAQALRF